MIEFKRSKYLQKLISHKHNRLVKIVTGVRRCGKSYLLPSSGGFAIRPHRILGFVIRKTLHSLKTQCATITFNNPSIPA